MMSRVVPAMLVTMDRQPIADVHLDGAAAQLLTADAGALTWVVDPELISAAEDMADGYEVLGPDGSRLEGCRLISAPRHGAQTMWLVTDGGDDVFIPMAAVVDIWTVAVAV